MKLLTIAKYLLLLVFVAYATYITELAYPDDNPMSWISWVALTVLFILFGSVRWWEGKDEK